MTKHKLTGEHRYTEFKEEAIAKRVRQMVQFKEAVDVQNEHIRLSYDNRKTGAAVPSISLIPVADCGNCKMCSRGCYDVRNVCYLPSVQKSRAVNSAILEQDRARYFDEVEAFCKFLRFFRWHVGGDIKDYDYLRRMVGIAMRNPQCEFLAFTKEYAIVNEWIRLEGEFPSNFHLLLSGWRGDTNVNEHNLPVSSPVWKDGSQSCMVTDNVTWCSGDCSACAEVYGGCWSAKKGSTILFEAH